MNIMLNDKFLKEIEILIDETNFEIFKHKFKEIKFKLINSDEFSKDGIYKVSREWIVEEIKQVEKSKTIDRAKYYLKKIKKGLTEIKTTEINDINLNRWREYNEVITDSLWIIDRRDNSGVHKAWYHGNFIPQIPRQMMIRYTKKYDVVVDTFLGSGTSLIECKRMGRHGIGVELNEEVAKKTKEIVNKEPNYHNVITDVVIGDSRKINFKEILEKHGFNSCQLLIMHPPYMDIIRFSDNNNDLSNAKTIDEFLKMFEEVVENTFDILDEGRYLVLVIGDKYYKGEWIPLGFYCMNTILKKGYKLKSIVVKNFEETKGKRNQKELWRYRALVGGFYVFKHEYIFIFQKVKK